MKDTKTSLLLLLSLVLLSISVILLSVWGYRFYKTSQRENAELTRYTQPASLALAATNSTRDSLRKIYATTIHKLDTNTGMALTAIDSLINNDADSLADNTSNKLREINKLKEDITAILKNNNNIEGLDIAKIKIEELQVKVAQLQNRNLNIERENKRLSALLQQLINGKNSIASNTNMPMGGYKNGSEKTTANESSFAALNLYLTALKENGSKDKETFEAGETEKLNGSFIIKSNNRQNGPVDIMVVVLQPNGKVLQNSTWESGAFDTPSGRKIYSRKIQFDNLRGEGRQVNFSLSTEKFLKGSYTFEVYCNGNVIGRLVKVLS